MNRQELLEQWKQLAPIFDNIVKQITRKAGLKTRQQFVNEFLDMNHSTFSNYCQGRNRPSDNIIKLVLEYAVDNEINIHPFIQTGSVINPQSSGSYVIDDSAFNKDQLAPAPVKQEVKQSQSDSHEILSESVQLKSGLLQSIIKSDIDYSGSLLSCIGHLFDEIEKIKKTLASIQTNQGKPVQLSLELPEENKEQQELHQLNRKMLDDKVKSVAGLIAAHTEKRYPQIARLNRDLVGHYCRELNTQIAEKIKRPRDEYTQDDFNAAHDILDAKKKGYVR